MEAKGTKSRRTLLIVAAVLGGGMLLFVLVLVIPAVLLLRPEGAQGPSQRSVYGRDSQEIQIPKGDGSQAPDFFDDLED